MSEPQTQTASILWHGVLLEVFGMGVLLTGDSGIGKSELALELISHGHRLIADDAPELTQIDPHTLQGCCPEALHGFLEVRGLGLLNIDRLFGAKAIKRCQRVGLLICLRQAHELNSQERLQGCRKQCTILGVNIPQINLPILPGRNLAVWVECAVRDQQLRLEGYHADQDLAQRLQQQMLKSTPCE